MLKEIKFTTFLLGNLAKLETFYNRNLDASSTTLLKTHKSEMPP